MTKKLTLEDLGKIPKKSFIHYKTFYNFLFPFCCETRV